MTIAELKKQLEQVPDDFEVVFETDEYFHPSVVSIKVEFGKKQVEVWVE